MRIRQATSADARAIADVHVRSWQAAYRGLVPQDYLDDLDPAQRQPGWERRLAETAWPGRGVLVAEADGDVVGFTSLLPTRDEDEDPAAVAEIATIYLTPETWGRGIGKALMTTALGTLTRAGYRQATLWVLDTNVRARRFYEAAGWHGDGATKRDTSRGFVLTELRYRRLLT
ncbi:GNAT family N-acetyltransferase [Nonomuraea angiospora]|uniref:GNAT family N-acetyltransferase n=1 Tax=Nonomuraea angiospora TaxID=46172 RepID=UPI00342D9F67